MFIDMINRKRCTREEIVEKCDPGQDGYRLEVLECPSNDTQIHGFIYKNEVEHECEGGIGMPLNTWHYVVFTYDGSHMKLYANGSNINTSGYTGGIGATSKNLTIGQYYWATWEGKLDEIRISDTARSGDWINTTYNNTNSPSTFYGVGDPEDPQGTDPVPDVSALVLFAAGLVVLVVWFGWAKRKRGVDG